MSVISIIPGIPTITKSVVVPAALASPVVLQDHPARHQENWRSGHPVRDPWFCPCRIRTASRRDRLGKYPRRCRCNSCERDIWKLTSIYRIISGIYCRLARRNGRPWRGILRACSHSTMTARGPLMPKRPIQNSPMPVICSVSPPFCHGPVLPRDGLAARSTSP